MSITTGLCKCNSFHHYCSTFLVIYAVCAVSIRKFYVDGEWMTLLV